MPFYDYECEGGHRFEQRREMDNRHDASCPVCEKPARLKVSLSSFRFAEPITVLQDLGNAPDGSHKGYETLDWKADSGISPKPGQPYKTAKEVEREG